MWRGSKEAEGGHCLIVWPKVYRAKELGWLRISDLRVDNELIDFIEFSKLPSVGANGGIIVAWRRHLGIVGAWHVNANSVMVQFFQVNGVSWWLTYVYGPQGMYDKFWFLRYQRGLSWPMGFSW